MGFDSFAICRFFPIQTCAGGAKLDCTHMKPHEEKSHDQ